ncbi:hypothetical protein D3C84_700760 [compost metagenome]
METVTTPEVAPFAVHTPFFTSPGIQPVTLRSGLTIGAGTAGVVTETRLPEVSNTMVEATGRFNGTAVGLGSVPFGLRPSIRV